MNRAVRTFCRRSSSTSGRAFKDNPLLREQAYIGPGFTPSVSGSVFPVVDPATGETVANVSDCGADDTCRAIQAAKDAFHSDQWRNTPQNERSAILQRLHDLFVSHSNDIAEIMTREAGKPITGSLGEITYSNSFLSWYSHEAKRMSGDILKSVNKPNQRMMFIRQPVGVVGIISPWNFPLAMITRKLGAAIATGCTAVIKPSEDTPLTALTLGELCARAGVPQGVVNVVPASRDRVAEVGDALCESPDVAKISFTGSTPVGKMLYRKSADTVKRMSLELGGNAPFIVFDSADIPAAVQGLMAAKFRNSGQACISANRVFVQSGIYDKFAAAFTAEMASLKFGNPLLPETSIGPLVNENGVKKVRRHFDDAVSRGARVASGGSDTSLGPCFFPPTVLTEVSRDALVNREETFGPLAALTRFDTEEEVVAMANDVRVGLAGYFYSRDLGQVFRVSERLEVGIVGVNEGVVSSEVAPFGGVKESGLGREGSVYGLDEFTELKYINLAL